MARSQVQYGSQGSDVKELQKLLNQNGYSLNEDGIFGSKTQAAVTDFQKKNNLAVDGIVGKYTWSALGNIADKVLSSANEVVSSANEAKRFNYDDFEYDAYTESDAVKNAQAALNAQLAQKPGEYKSQWQSQLDDTINKILNREKFSYDLNGDALYQQYKDKYIKQGKMAMGDAIGQASAMTGGYGNSYAQSVGQQAYQAQLDNLNDIVPELYQMAYDKYNQEGQDLYNQYAMLGDRENMDYGRYRDSVADWQTERDYLAGRYDSERDYDYSKYVDDRNFSYGQYSDDKSLAYTEYRNAIDDAFKKEQFDYQKERDRIEDEQWQKRYDAGYGNTSTGGTGGGSGGGSSGGGSYTGGNGNTGGNSSGNGNGGGNKTDNVSTSGVTQEIRNKAASFESNTALGDYLDVLESRGVISADEADALYAQYMDGNEKYNKNDDGTYSASYKSMLQSSSGWSVIDDGGVNWFGVGIDADAIVKAPNGEQIRLDNLRNKLVSEGMSTSEANKLIKSLMKNLDI